MAHPEISRQRLALVKMLWGHHSVWSGTGSRARYVATLMQPYLSCFIVLEPWSACGPQIQLHFSATLIGFDSVRPSRPERLWQLRARATALTPETQAQA